MPHVWQYQTPLSRLMLMEGWWSSWNGQRMCCSFLDGLYRIWWVSRRRRVSEVWEELVEG